MDYFYDGQIRRYVTQFMRIFIGFKYRTGGETPEERHVPVMYGDMSRQTANIIKENSENKLLTVPRISCYISGLELDTSRVSDYSFTSKIHIRERAYEDIDGERVYKNIQGGTYTVERLMPTPFKLSLKADIWTSNTDQKLQLMEQILVLFNPSLEIQTTDNYIDWTSLTTIDINNITFSSRTIPAGTESEIDICTIDFITPIWISPPAKVKKLGIVKNIIMNVFTEAGNIADLNTLIFNNDPPQAQVRISPDGYRILLLRNPTTQQYECSVVDKTEVVNRLKLEPPLKGENRVDWTRILDLHGGVTGTSRIFFLQPNGYEISGTFTVNEVEPKIMVIDFDDDTLPTNTVLSSVNGSRGTIDAIVDPVNFNPIEKWGSVGNIPVGTRYLLLDNIGDPNSPDGPDGWKGTDGSTQTSYQLFANDIVEWSGTRWATVFSSASSESPTYVTNLRTGVQYKWEDGEWLKSFEGEYAAGYWRFELDN
jgi:hypothetical protein